MTDHIQIPNVIPRIQYTGNGTQTVFIYPFPVFNAAQMRVTLNGAVQESQFTVLNAGKTTGGTVVFDKAPINGATVTLERRLPLQRISDFIEGGELSANALNNEFDTLTAIAQQLDNAQSAMLRFGADETAPVTLLPAKTNRANKVLGFDASGAPDLYETTQTYATPTYSQSGTGAVSRNVSGKARESVSVRDFGAVGDGIADDTTALQNALAAHNAVFLPSGIYRVTATIEIGDNKTLSGTGSAAVIKAANNGFDTVALIGSRALLRDMVIDGGDSGLRLYGKTAPCVANTVSNIQLKNQRIGVQLDGYVNPANPCDGNRFTNILIDKPTLHGVLVTRSGFGQYPNANKFNAVRVTSSGVATTGCGFYIQGGRFYNSFTDCEALMGGTVQACFRIGGDSQKVLVQNLTTEGSNTVPNLLLDAGSLETVVVNLQSNSNGAAILDNSGGNYIAFNAGFPDKNRLGRTRVGTAVLEQHYYDFNVVAPAFASTIAIDLTKTTTMVNAANGAITMQLPRAAAANAGAVVILKKTDQTGNFVSVTENGGSGPEGRTLVFGSSNDTATLFSDGATWRILSTNVLSYNTLYRNVAGNYAPDITRPVHLVDATAGFILVILPPANSLLSVGRMVTVKKIDASANVVRVVEEGSVGPDNTVMNLSTRYAAITMVSNGGSWHVIGKV